MNELAKSYNQYEDELIKKFNGHKSWEILTQMSNEEFISYLLQLGHISMEFVKFIERAKFAIEDESVKEVVRNILRDEIPSTGLTHQDNRINDLKKIGLFMDKILNTPATEPTKKLIEDYYKLISYPQDNYDLKVLIILRVIGEVLVGETYRHVVEELVKRFKFPKEDFLFYTFHWLHDQKGGTGDRGGMGHTEYYDQVLEKKIENEKILEIAKQSTDLALQVRCRFQDQFIK